MKKKLFYNDSILVSSLSDTEKRTMQYQGFNHCDMDTVFKKQYSGYCTNNVAEFMAIANAIFYCKKNRLHFPIYSNNKTAISWIKHRKVKTALYKTIENAVLFDDFQKIQKWLKKVEYSNPILLWDSRNCGKIFAHIKRCERMVFKINQ